MDYSRLQLYVLQKTLIEIQSNNTGGERDVIFLERMKSSSSTCREMRRTGD